MGLLLIACSGSTLLAQAQNAVEPPSPRLRATPNSVHWMIEFKYPQTGTSGEPGSMANAGPVPPGFVAKLEIVKFGTLKRVTLTQGDGTTRRFLHSGDLMVVKSPSGVYYLDNIPGGPPYPYGNEAFPLCEWVRSAPADAYLGTVEYKGVTCHHYRASSQEAWIDVESLLPVAAYGDGVMAFYRFLDPPSGPIPIDPGEAEAIKMTATKIRAMKDLR